MNAKPTPQNWDDFKKEGRTTLYRAIAGGLISGAIAASVGIWTYISQLPGPIGLVPNGAIMAFDLESKCPDGWIDIGKEEYQRFAGRVIVAAGPPAERDINSTTTRSYNEQGGQETVKLEEKHLAKHRHGIPYATTTTIYTDASKGTSTPYFDYRNRKDIEFRIEVQKASEGVAPTIGDEPHENMPPYIALYLCKKV